MKTGKGIRIIINVVLFCAMLAHGIYNVTKLASDAANSAPAWTGAWVCLIYIVVMIAVNAVFSVLQKDKRK